MFKIFAPALVNLITSLIIGILTWKGIDLLIHGDTNGPYALGCAMTVFCMYLGTLAATKRS
ncbi:MAG: hypothetical protein EOP04_04585 [Proteobacteria bacterium]|nr:MAG: hypothetical protein EOP04_04585 [Pseudomonadota bacterium]